MARKMNHTEILTNLRKIIRAVNLEGKRMEKEHGISIPQLLCLNYLNEKDDYQASHKEIKNFIQLNASTVTGIISRLEKKGLVARLPSPSDRRVGLICLTAQGARLLENIPDDPLHEQLAAKLEQLSPERCLELQQAFKTIIDFLNIEKLDASPVITSGTDLNPSEEE